MKQSDLKNCPCYQCLCIPVCRFKGFNTLMLECDIIKQYYYFDKRRTRLYRVKTFETRMEAIESVLKPVWSDLINLIQEKTRESM